jgi:hypothetical protein
MTWRDNLSPTEWAATHRVTMGDLTVPVMLVDGIAYSEIEWSGALPPHFKVVDGDWLFQEQPFSGSVEPITYAITLNAGAGCDERHLAICGDLAEARSYVEKVPGVQGEWTRVGGNDDHPDLYGMFLCPPGCGDHTDDGHPFVFALPCGGAQGE